MDDHRHDQRYRVLRAGRMLLNNKSSVIDCSVRNLSRGGACLEVTSVRDIPPLFDLQISGEEEDRVCVEWSGNPAIGSAFRFASDRSRITRRRLAKAPRACRRLAWISVQALTSCAMSCSG